MKTIFVKMNNKRLPKFQILTRILEKDGKKYVIKEAMTKEAEEFIKCINKNYYILKEKYKNINLLKPIEVKNNKIYLEYLEGDSLATTLIKAIKKDNKEKFNSLINKYFNFIDKFIEKRNAVFKPCRECEKIFGKFNKIEGKKVDVIKISNIDLIFSNIFLTQDEEFIIIDYEWVFNFPLPKDYIIWRAFNYFFYKDLFYVFNLEKDLYKQNEENFQRYVNGKYNILENKLKKIYDIKILAQKEEIFQKYIEERLKKGDIIKLILKKIKNKLKKYLKKIKDK